MLFPPPSLPCSVSVTPLPDCTLPLDTVMSDWAGEIVPDVAVAPTFNVTAGNAGGLIWNVWAPTLEPSAASTLARPKMSALTVVWGGAPPVGDRNRTPLPPPGRLF